MSYSAKFGSYGLADDNDAMFFNTEMLATTLTCQYDPNVSKDLELGDFEIDSVAEPDKVRFF